MFKDPFVEDFDKSRANKISDLLKEITGLRFRPEPYKKGAEEITFSCKKLMDERENGYWLTGDELLEKLSGKAKLYIFEDDESNYKVKTSPIIRQDESGIYGGEIKITVKNEHDTVINLEKIMKDRKKDESVDDASNRFAKDIKSRTKGMDRATEKQFIKDVIRSALYAFPPYGLRIEDREETLGTFRGRTSSKAGSRDGIQK